MIEKLYKKKNILKTFLELKYNIEFFFLRECYCTPIHHDNHTAILQPIWNSKKFHEM